MTTWSRSEHAATAAKYDADEVKLIKDRIRRAAKKQGVEIEGD